MGVLPATVLITGAVWLIASSPGSLQTVPQQDRAWAPTDRPSASVSADGRHVAFASYAALAAADTNRIRDIYVLDRADGRVTLESPTSAGDDAQAWSGYPRISGDGRFVAYITTLPGSSVTAVVLRDRRDASLTTVSVPPAGGPPDARSRDAVISADGTVVAFSSGASNLVEGTDANGSGEDIFIYETLTRSLSRLGVDRVLDPKTGISVSPALSADGRFVAFASAAAFADDRAQSRKRGLSAIYIADRERGELRRVSDPGVGRSADGSSWDPAISADGRYIAFVSSATNLVPGDRNRAPDVFLRDVLAGSLQLVSRSAETGNAANARSGAPGVSSDGRFVVFQSEASDLVCSRQCETDREDINLLWDVFVFDRLSRTVARVSGDSTGGWMAPSAGPAIDPAGRLVVFSSRQPTDASDTANDFDLFLCDVRLRTSVLGLLRERPHGLDH